MPRAAQPVRHRRGLHCGSGCDRPPHHVADQDAHIPEGQGGVQEVRERESQIQVGQGELLSHAAGGERKQDSVFFY